MSISIIAGLGNPGDAYQGSRHNIGFDVVDALAREAGATWQRDKRFKMLHCKIAYGGQVLILVKPQAYMNASGSCLQKVCSFYKIPPKELVVVHDDINLELGRVKISELGGPGGHNGVADIISHLGEQFIRFRVGIGGKLRPEMDLVDHVLGRFQESEKGIMDTRLVKFVEGLKLLIDKGVKDAMNLINQKTQLNERNDNTQL